MACHIGVLPEEVLQVILPAVSSDGGNTGADAHGMRKVLRLPHPRTGVPSLFLPYELENGASSILEIQAVDPPNSRSWFLADEVVEDGKLLIMTPVDPTFVLLPILRAAVPADGKLGAFRPADDIFEEAGTRIAAQEPSIPLTDVGHLLSLRCVQSAMRRMCEVKEITPEITVFRYSQDILVEYLRKKVTRLSGPGVLEGSRTITRTLAKEGFLEDGNEGLLVSARTKAACDLVSQYLPRDIYEALLASYDFAALNAHLKVLREEDAALVAAKMSKIEAKEAGDSKSGNGEKKRKAPAKTSFGVEKLKKANTKGMSKLSTFFQKK